MTKINAAEAHIGTAVRMFFEGGHPVPIFMLANAAWEIVEQIGSYTEVTTVQEELASDRGLAVDELLRPMKTIANFLKHADRDPTATIEIEENAVIMVLQLACHDFGRITGGMPIEAQIYEAWATTIAFRKVSDAPLRKQELIRKAIAHFPGIRSADSAGRRAIGLDVLNRAIRDPSLEMTFSREVVLPAKSNEPRGRL
ncbi:hypothetical protein [Bradyrhizobium sp.]|uniref:hypothetical protein n=1 Tax=Bradyrhizobium sp. TaxID=376 RepID=UPI003BAFA6FE